MNLWIVYGVKIIKHEMCNISYDTHLISSCILILMETVKSSCLILFLVCRTISESNSGLLSKQDP